jgi:histidine triad (HIT) family protein
MENMNAGSSRPAKACIFCEIVAGREVSSKVFEDDRILAFMTIRPARPGEFSIIPKQHIDHFCDIPDDLAAHIIIHAQRLSRIVREKLKPKRVGLVVHGFGVPHAHLVVVPLHRSEDITSASFAYLKDGKISFGVDHIPVTPRDELDRMAELLRDK